MTTAPPKVPAALIAKLAGHDRLVAPVGSLWMQELIVIDKGATERSVCPVSFEPMQRSK